MTASERLAELLRGPFRRRVGGHIVMQDSAGAQIHDDKYVQRSENRGDDNEEVARRDRLGMVADESQPPLLRIGRANRSTDAQVLSYTARRYPNAELQFQFVGDSLLTPGRIPGCHL